MPDKPTMNVPGSAFTPDDPCAYCRQLKEAYRNIISGKGKSQIQYLAGGITRMVAYSKPDLQQLAQEVRQAENDCAASIGIAKPNRRFAIEAGALVDDFSFPFRTRRD